MLTNFFSQKMLSLSDTSGRLQAALVPGRDSSTWCCDLIPTDFTGGTLALVKWLAGDQVASLLDAVLNFGGQVLDPIIQINGSKLEILGLASLEIDRFRLSIDKQTSSAAIDAQQTVPADELPSDQVFTLAFSGTLALEGVASLSGDLVLQIKRGSPPALQFQLNSNSQFAAIHIPLPGIGPDLVLLPSVLALDVVREKNTGSTTNSLVSEGRIGISGGPEWLDGLLPDELAFNFSIASTKDLSGQSKLLLSLTIPEIMDDVTLDLPAIPNIINIPGLPNFSMGSVNLLLSNLSVVMDGSNGFKPYMTLDCSVGLPAEFNRLAGTDGQGDPVLEWANTYDPDFPAETRVTGRLIVDEELVQFKPLTSPIKGIQTTPQSSVPGSQKGSTWIIDLGGKNSGDNGLIHLQPPTFAKSNTSRAMAASGGFEIKRPLNLSLDPIKSLIDGLLFDGASILLPDRIEIKDINILDGNNLNTTALAELWGGTLPSALNAVFSQLSSLIEHMPDQLKSYLNFTIPDSFNYNFRMNADGSCIGGIKLPDDQPLRILLPAGMSLLGIELRQASLGQLNGGKLGLLELDVVVDHFFLPEVLASMALNIAKVPMLPDSNDLYTRLELREVMAIINFQNGVVVPLFYDKIGIGRLGAEGFDLASEFRLPKPSGDILDITQLASMMVDFLTLPASDERGLLDPATMPEVLSTEFVIGEQYLKTPKYTGEVLLGKENEPLLTIESDDLWPYLAHSLNFLKTGRIDEFLQAFPIEYRIGRKSLNFFGLANIAVDWLISSPEEFSDTAYARLGLSNSESSQVLALLPDMEEADPNRLVTLLRGEVDIAGVVNLDSTFAFSGGLTGVTTGFRFNGELANLVGLELIGKVALETDPPVFEVMGASRLCLLGTRILEGQVGIKNDLLYLSGALNLFPDSNILSLTAEVEGQFSASGINILGTTDFRVGGVSLISGEVLLTQSLLKVVGSCLGVETELAIRQQNGQLQIDGGLTISESLTIKTQDIVVQGIKLSDPLKLETSIDVDLGISASLNRFSLHVAAAFTVLDQGFDINLNLSVMPSSVDDLLQQLLSEATRMVQSFVTNLLNRPEKLLEVIARAALAITDTNVSAISIDSDDGDIGLLSLQNRLFNMTALVTYNGGDTLDNLFAYAQSNQAAIRSPSFKVEGIALAMACNRGVSMPKAGKVKDFPLIKRLRNNDEIGDEASDLAASKAKQAVAELTQYLPRKRGTYTLAAGIKANSFKLVNSTNVFMMEMGNDLAAYLVGTSSIKLPPKPLTTVVNMEINYRAAIDLTSGSVKIDGKLTNNSYVLSKAAKLSGGFAYHSWLAGPHAGDFVVTMGGYAPGFNRPSHYPAVPRLKLNWRISSQLSAKGNMYMALTPTNIMAGGNLDAVFKTGPLKASFDAGINYMMYWQPFFYKAHIDIDISAAVTLKVKISYGFGSFTIRKTFRAGLGAELDIWGPKFAGKAKVKWTIFSFTIKFGSSSKPEPKPISWSKFRADYLSNGNNLEPELAIASGALGIMTDKGKQWQVVDPDKIELTCNSKFPLKKLTVQPSDTNQQNKAWTTHGSDFHLAPTDPGGPETADDWYLDMQYDGPDGMYFQGETIEQDYPKAVWGSSFKPKPSRNPTLSLLSGTRIVPQPGKPPGFTDAVDADEFKFQDVVENDPTWQWGGQLNTEFCRDEASNESSIRNTINSADAVYRRSLLADFIDYDEAFSLASVAERPQATFIGVPRSAIEGVA